MKYFELNSGQSIPAVGLGTWKAEGEAARTAVSSALRTGYRHIDCAWLYGNEKQVGQGIADVLAEGVVPRERLFVTSKLWNSFFRPQDVERGLEDSLTKLGLEYVDLYLLHWPMPLRPGTGVPQSPEDFVRLTELPLERTWDALIKLKERGLVRAIGVSNFGPRRLKALIASTGFAPAVNQVELHPYNPWPELLDTCAECGVHATAYAPLGSLDRPAFMKQPDEPHLLDHPVVEETAANLGVTPAQLLIAWAIARGTSAIPKSTHPGRIAENLAAADLTLPATALAALSGIPQRFRFVNPTPMFIQGVNYEGDSFWD